MFVSVIPFNHTGKDSASSNRNCRWWFPGCNKFLAVLNFWNIGNPNFDVSTLQESVRVVRLSAVHRDHGLVTENEDVRRCECALFTVCVL